MDPDDERDRLAHLRDLEHRSEFAVRRGEEEMEELERALERRLKEFERDEQEIKRRIRAEWRREHHGHDPERPPDWDHGS
jgi:hypothetical protein